jgi:hypothetical protein
MGIIFRPLSPARKRASATMGNKDKRKEKKKPKQPKNKLKTPAQGKSGGIRPPSSNAN